jgi:hypothetical protein
LPSVTNPGDSALFAVLLAAEASRSSIQWHVDGSPVDGTTSAAGEELRLDPRALGPGTHSVVALARHEGREAALSWQLQVPARPVENRPPVVIQAVPPDGCEVPKGQTVRLYLVADDVDLSDVLRYTWFVDGRRTGGDSPLLELATGDLAPGIHEARVEVRDGVKRQETTAYTWEVEVTEDPRGGRSYISSAWPAGTARVEPPGRVRFEVDVEVLGGERPAFSWQVDGIEVPAQGKTFDFDPAASENGQLRGPHRITCTLASPGAPEGAAAQSVGWTVLLDPPGTTLGSSAGRNNPPEASLVTPEGASQARPGETRAFRVEAFDPDGDALTHTWLVNGVAQVADGSVFTYLVEDGIQEAPVTIELFAADGHTESDRLARWTLTFDQENFPALTLATGAVVIDDGKAGTSSTGSWYKSGGTNPYGSTSLYAKAVGATYSYQAALTAGTYEILLWWSSWPSRPLAVPVTIQHSGGTAKVIVNQTVNGGRWNRLGAYTFGTTGKVTITCDSASASTCADAVCFNPTGAAPPPAGEIVIDDGTTGTTASGDWFRSGGANPYGTRSLFAKDTGWYAFSRSISAPASYDVYAWWTDWPTRERQVPYEIAHQGGTAVVHVDQITGGGRWNLLGRYSFGSSVKVTIRVPGSASVCADAVRFVPASAPPPPPPPGPATTYSVEVYWTAPTTNANGTLLTDLAGFKLHWGTASRQYTKTADTGLSTSHIISQLAAGTYYFAAIAYDTLGNESVYSTELRATVP